MDGGTTRPLFNVYHASPQGDGESTMEIGVGAAGSLKVQNIELDGTSLTTTLTGKQDSISSSSTLDVGTIQNSLLTNATIGANWKYQNAASYPVVNENNNNILERIDPVSGGHNWYAAGNSNIVMAWQPQNDRLFLSGDVLADKYLHNVSGTNVNSYGFYQFTGTSGTINMNTTGGIDVPWTAQRADGTCFSQGTTGSTQIRIMATGYFEINFNIYLTSTAQRANPTLRIRINGNDTGYLAWSYIRSQNNHNESSWCLSPVLMNLNENDILSIQGRMTNNGVAGGCYLYNQAGSTNRAYPTLMLKRVA